MEKLRSRSKAFMIVDEELDRSTLWCLCGRIYVFNGSYNKQVSSISGQISCSCYGEGLVDFDRLAKTVKVTASSFTGTNQVCNLDTANNVHTDFGPYSVSRKSSTINYAYTKVGRKLVEGIITSGITIKNVPGQTPRILKWQRGGGRDDIKNVTYIGGSSAINGSFIHQAWNHLKPVPSTTDGTYIREPRNGVELMYFLALPQLARNTSLNGYADRFIAHGRSFHLNADAHLLHSIVSKSDTIDFIRVVTGGLYSQELSEAIQNSKLSMPTIHFLSFVFKEDIAELIKALSHDQDWSFYDVMLCDRIMSSYMSDLWSFFKWLKTKLTPIQMNSYYSVKDSQGNEFHGGVRVITISRLIYDTLVTFRKLSPKGLEYLKSLTLDFSGTSSSLNQIQDHVVYAYRLSNEGELASANQLLPAPEVSNRGRVSSTTIGRKPSRRTN